MNLTELINWLEELRDGYTKDFPVMITDGYSDRVEITESMIMEDNGVIVIDTNLEE